MALTLDSIYKPVNDFFVNLYKTAAGSPVYFRFDQFGSSDDFTDDAAPGADVVLERFSDLVNRVPVEQDDGMNIVFSANLIDDTYYYRLLNASIPLVDETDPYKEAIQNSLVKITGDARLEYDKLSLPRLGIPTLFRASYSHPDNWYQTSDKDTWKDFEFEASEPVTPVATPTPNNPKTNLWKLKLSDTALEQILDIKSEEPIKATAIFDRSLKIKRNPLLFNLATRVTAVQPLKVEPKKVLFNSRRVFPINANITASASAMRPVTTVAPVNNFTLHNMLQSSIGKLDLKQRYFVNQVIKEIAPAEPATTNKIKISFKYCKVDVQRLWLFAAFLNTHTWFVPGCKKGELSDPAIPGSISVLPIGFIAIKDLSIEANWSESDIDNSKTATDFGPFQINSGIVNNKLTNDGIQIIGWMLQKMPVLPPNDPPGAAPPVTQV